MVFNILCVSAHVRVCVCLRACLCGHVCVCARVCVVMYGSLASQTTNWVGGYTVFY